MLHKTTAQTPKKKREEKAAKVKRILAGPSRRDDYDDEDQDWKWVYASEIKEDEDEEKNEDEDLETPRKRKRRAVTQTPYDAIVGARTSSLDIRIGDTVLIDPDTSGSGTFWVALILNFVDGEKGMSANVICKRIGIVNVCSF